jgi:hypothetical protein
MEKRYTALRTIGTIYKILGIIAAILTVIAIVAVCATSIMGGAALSGLEQSFGTGSTLGGGLFSALGGLVGALLLILYGGGAAITFYGIGEGIYLLISLEENTRATARMLAAQQQQPVRVQPAPPVQPVPPPAG